MVDWCVRAELKLSRVSVGIGEHVDVGRVLACFEIQRQSARPHYVALTMRWRKITNKQTTKSCAPVLRFRPSVCATKTRREPRSAARRSGQFDVLTARSNARQVLRVLRNCVRVSRCVRACCMYTSRILGQSQDRTDHCRRERGCNLSSLYAMQSLCPYVNTSVRG